MIPAHSQKQTLVAALSRKNTQKHKKTRTTKIKTQKGNNKTINQSDKRKQTQVIK